VAERPIVIFGDPVLREISKPVDRVDQQVKDLVSEMTGTLRKARGLGLAAVQIGVPKRIFLVDLSVVNVKESLLVFINPEIIASSGEVEMEEGCLSFPDLYQKITRPAMVTVRALDADGQSFEMSADGLAARAILHEYDHLEGKLFIDYLSPLTRQLLKGRLKKLSATCSL
jgi:peptide deformylase